MGQGLTCQQMRREDRFFRKDLVRVWPQMNAQARNQFKLGLLQSLEDTKRAATRHVVVWTGEGDPLPEEQHRLEGRLATGYRTKILGAMPGVILVGASPTVIEFIMSTESGWQYGLEGRFSFAAAG